MRLAIISRRSLFSSIEEIIGKHLGKRWPLSTVLWILGPLIISWDLSRAKLIYSLLYFFGVKQYFGQYLNLNFCNETIL